MQYGTDVEFKCCIRSSFGTALHLKWQSQIKEELGMKVGDKVEVIGSRYTGEKGTIRRRCKISIPGEPQVEGWEVKLSYGAYKLNEQELKLITD